MEEVGLLRVFGWVRGKRVKNVPGGSNFLKFALLWGARGQFPSYFESIVLDQPQLLFYAHDPVVSFEVIPAAERVLFFLFPLKVFITVNGKFDLINDLHSCIFIQLDKLNFCVSRLVIE